MILLLIITILFLLYGMLIIYFWFGWKSIPYFTPADKLPQIKISVVIAGRNEEENIGNLLLSLQKQTYPSALFEIIVVDDHSTDNTADIVKKFKDARLLQLSDLSINSYKKKAIETGIAAATGDWILTTDADCNVPPGWLKTIAAFIEEKKAVFVAAPVVLTGNNSVLQLFQSIDFMMLQGITGAAVHKKTLNMCNGANLAYERKVFHEVNGFAGIDHIASGDDMLLMHKIGKKYPGGIHYLKSKEAIVSTPAMKTWKTFFHQRIRWASKARAYDDKRIFWVLLLVYIFNLSFLLLLVAVPIAIGSWYPYYLIGLIGLWILKTVVELPFVYSVADFFGKRSLVKYFFFFQPLHIFYTIVSGLFGQFGKYEWKGRRVK